ncbi:MAG: hypothetical protein C0621_09785 [Desulfuromonas sp.]|nr:MAG: hypothetical protein C0621_09785 [Desulfuromonas sp.]
MTPLSAAVRDMTFNEQVEYGLCTRGLMLEQGPRTYRLSAGTTDTVHVFEESTILYVLTVNLHLEYVALDWYQGNEPEPIDSVFLQGEAINECIGCDWRDISELELAKRLALLFA